MRKVEPRGLGEDCCGCEVRILKKDGSVVEGKVDGEFPGSAVTLNSVPRAGEAFRSFRVDYAEIAEAWVTAEYENADPEWVGDHR